MKTGYFIQVKGDDGPIIAHLEFCDPEIMRIIEAHGLTVIEAPVVTVSRSLPEEAGVIQK